MKKEKIILVGDGEHARCIIDNIEDIGNIEIFGLTSNNSEHVGKKVCGYEVIGKEEEIDDIFAQNKDLTGYFLAIGTLYDANMKVREEKARWLDKKYRAINIIHPTAIISKYAEIGHGNIFEAYTRVANGAKVGSHCILYSFSAVNHDQVVGNNVLIGGNVSMAGKTVGNNVIISDGASISFKKSVGNNCVIGDGAVVTKDIPDNWIAVGNPAKFLKWNTHYYVE